MERRAAYNRNRYGVYSMLFNWVISAGAIIFLLIFTRLVSKSLFPAFVLAVSLGLYYYVRNNRFSDNPVCCVLPFIVSKALFYSALIMVFINFLHHKQYIYLIFTDVELVNPAAPYITALVIFPVLVAMLGKAMWQKVSLPYCVDCQRLFGSGPERGFMGEFYGHEGRYQLKNMFAFSLGLGAVCYAYYFFAYINVTYSDLDLYIFNVAPALILLFSMIYVSIRYVGTWNYFRQNFDTEPSNFGRTTKIRFLILNGEEMLLKLSQIAPDDFVDDLRIDTPVSLVVRRRLNVTVDDAAAHFRNITNIDDFKIRFLYSNTTGSNDFSVYHFLVELPSKTIPDGARLKGEWFTLHEITDMLNNQAINPLLSTEMIRLHLITMAYKTYDINGDRRYAIKKYKPLYRLSDIANEDIDYNDVRWLYISDHNADKPFFKVRRLWSRYVSGAFKQAKTEN